MIWRILKQLKNKLVSPKNIKKHVLIGKDGWLFLYSGMHHQFNYLRGIQSPSIESIKNFKNNIVSRIEFCDQKKIDYLHVVFPSKPLVKSHYLPDNVADVSSLYRRHYFKSVNEAGIADKILYPLEELQQEEEFHSTFYKYDTHNSTYGSLKIANMLMEKLGYPPIHESFLNETTRSHGGDLARAIGNVLTVSEEFVSLNLQNVYMIDNTDFLSSNTGHVRIYYNTNPGVSKKLLIFGDSFFEGTMPFLIHYFKDIIYIRSPHLLTNIVDGCKPDIVLTGNAERYLSDVASDDIAGNFLENVKGNKVFLEAFNAHVSFSQNPLIYDEWVRSQILSKRSKNTIPCSYKHQDADILRDVAIYFEKNGDIETALTIMRSALKLRPNGPLIKKKCEQYNVIIEAQKQLSNDSRRSSLSK